MSDPRYLGNDMPEGLGELLPLVRITISAASEPHEGQVALVVGMEVGHPLPANIVNTREVFTLLHRALPDLERKLRAEWVEHRKVCSP